MMKYLVTHTSPDWDAIGSVWLIKKYLSGWQEAGVKFVPAGQRVANSKYKIVVGEELRQVTDDVIENIGGDEYLHVDTGLGPLDHHQTNDMHVCGMSRVWEYIQKEIERGKGSSEMTAEHVEAVSRIVKIIVQIDHFQEVFWGDPVADYQEFSLNGTLDGLKLAKPNADETYLAYGIESLNALVHEFENRIWAEKEIEKKGTGFTTRWGKGIGFETINDAVLKLSQKMGYEIVVRKDPHKGYVRIKLRPAKVDTEQKGGDLTLAYENLRKIDPDATWFLHISKKMLLNGTPKNPDMVPTKLSLKEIIKVLSGV